MCRITVAAASTSRVSHYCRSRFNQPCIALLSQSLQPAVCRITFAATSTSHASYYWRSRFKQSCVVLLSQPLQPAVCRITVAAASTSRVLLSQPLQPAMHRITVAADSTKCQSSFQVTMPFRWTHKQRSAWVRLGDRGGHKIGPIHPSHRSEK